MERFKGMFVILAVLSVVAPLCGGEAWAQTGGSDEVERYIGSLKDSLWQIRWHAVTALGDMKDPRAVVPLFATLKDENSYVRATTAWALGENKGSPRDGTPHSCLERRKPWWQKERGIGTEEHHREGLWKRPGPVAGMVGEK